MTAYRLIQGDCIEVMRGAKAESVHAIVCDPPYALQFMGLTWDSPAKMLGMSTGANGGFHNLPPGTHRPDIDKCDGELFGQWCEAWATEALRLLKPGGHLLAFGGTRMYHWLAVGIERAGFEIRDSIAWHYSSGMPKAKKVAGHDGWKTACLKPAFEPIVVARKPPCGTVRANMDEHGVGAFHIDACRVGNETMVVAPGMAGWNKYRHDGGYQDTDAVEPTVNEGRFPANVMLEEGVAEEMARYFFVAKPSPAERHAGLDRNPHSTVKPIALMRELVRLVAPPGSQILDPFAGSGTTGIAAMLEGMKFIGIELDPEYAEAARLRIDHWTKEIA